MNKKPKITTKQFRLSDIEDLELRERLEHKYIGFSTHKRDLVEKLRVAEAAAARASIAAANVSLAQTEFLIEAGDAFDLVATEPNWILRRDHDGVVVLECLLTESDMQKVARHQVSKMKEQVNETGPEPGGMFGDDD